MAYPAHQTFTSYEPCDGVAAPAVERLGAHVGPIVLTIKLREFNYVGQHWVAAGFLETLERDTPARMSRPKALFEMVFPPVVDGLVLRCRVTATPCSKRPDVLVGVVERAPG